MRVTSNFSTAFIAVVVSPKEKTKQPLEVITMDSFD